MQDINSSAVKLVIAGPVGAGKTTTIRTLSDSEPVSTEMPMSEPAMGDKTTTTVAFDFSTVLLDDGQPLFIYGLPGQERFEHMWSIILEGAFGVLLVLDATGERLQHECEGWLAAIEKIAPGTPVVIGLTKTDLLTKPDLRSLRANLAKQGLVLPVFSFDARDKAQANHMVRALLASIV